jgi:hypothetical protein
MDRNKLLSFFGLSLLFTFLIELFLKPTINWPGMIGKGIGLFLWTLLLTYILKGLFHIFKSDFDSKRFYKVYLVLWSIFLVSIIVSSMKIKESIVNIQPKESQRYIYSPSNCIYEVTFPEKPILKQASVENGSGFVNGEVGELILKDKGVQKIEFYQLDKSLIENMNKAVLLNFLKEYSKNNGLSNCDYLYEDIELGRKAKLRGYKTLQDSNRKDKEITYEVVAYVKEDNFMVLYAGCESKIYPTNEITAFLNSIKLKKNGQ